MFWVSFFIYLFLFITFGYSAFEKIIDFKGSVEYYKSYFNGIFIAKYMQLILLLIIIIEVITSLFLCVGIYEVWTNTSSKYGLYGLITASTTLLCFLFGQRLAKDYDGARGIAIYFILCMIGFFSN